MRRFYHSVVARLFKHFFQGLILVAPLGITAIVLYYSFVYLDNLVPFEIPGLGILMVVTAITLAGWISSFVAAPVLAYFEQMFTRTPLIKIIYTSVKDLLSAFVGNKRKFSRAVIVKISTNPEMERLGFLTDEMPRHFGCAEGKITVYLPYSYSMMGVTLVVDPVNVREIDIPPADVMKYIVSGGVTRVEGL